MVKSGVNLLNWLLIGCSLLCSQSGASLLIDPNLDNDYNSKVSIPAGSAVGPALAAVEGGGAGRCSARRKTRELKNHKF